MDIEIAVKNIVIDALNLDIAPEELAGSTPLIGEGLMVNSVMALQILIFVEREFSFEIEDEDLDNNILADIDHLIAFVRDKTRTSSG